MRGRRIVAGLIASAFGLCGQTFTQRGFVDVDLFGFPQTAPNDAGHAVGSALVRWEASYQPVPWLTLSGGLEAQTDTHHQVERTFHFDTEDRGLLRPAFDLRKLVVTLHKGHFTADIGKQFIHWGKADILNPTDRFAPKDYLNVVDSGVLGVVAARVNVEYHGTSIDLIAAPRFTPSRMPLLDERWAPVPAGEPAQIVNAASIFPGGGQYGVRVDHIGHGYEVSASMFEGYNPLPLLVPLGDPQILYLQRFYPKIRTYGTDAAIPMPFATLKVESAWFDTRETSANAPRSDNYVLWVAQLERQVRQWVFVAGYAGQTVFENHYAYYFDPERGLTRTILVKAVYNPDAPTSFSIQTATRQDGRGTWTTAEYSRQLATHWRVIGGISVIAGDRNDFLGQYKRNSFGVLRVRYSF